MSLRSLNYHISGIIPNQQYYYNIENLSSNWPVKITPISGIINSISNQTTIRGKADFCDNLDDCSDSTYLEALTDHKTGDDPFIDLRVKLTSSILDNPIYSDTVSLVCSGCTPVPSVSLSSNFFQAKNTNEVTGINIVFNNLKPYSLYKYLFTDLGSNYPVALSYLPKSGMFVSSSESRHTLRSDVKFCDSSSCSPVFGTGHLSKISNDTNEKYYANFNIALESSYLQQETISETISVECVDCFPDVQISTPSAVTLTASSGNSHTFATSFSGLKPYTRYNYSFKNIDNNHKVSFNTLSGYFYTKETNNKIIATTINFCENINVCDYPFSLGTSAEGVCDQNKFTKFYVELSGNNNTINSDEILINCDGCLPKPSIVTNNNIKLTAASGNVYNFDVRISGLKPYSDYTYSFKNFAANHLVGLRQISGTINSRNLNTATISNELVFCESSNYCNAYSTTGTINPNTCSSVLYAIFNLELNSNCLSSPLVSDRIKVDCDSCLPTLNISVPAKTTLTATSGNTRDFSIGVSGLKPNSNYSYLFKDFSTNHLVGLKQISGTISTNNSNMATIPNTFIFCESSGYCNQYVTTGTINNNVCDNLLSSRFRLELNSSCLANPILSDNIELECDNCIKKISVSLPINDINLTSNNIISLTGVVSGLKPNHSYDYYFNGEANWPVVLSNISGSFISPPSVGSSKTSSYNAITKVLFCSPSGICLGDPGLLTLINSSPAEKILDNNSLVGQIKLSIKPSVCSDETYASNVTKVLCNNCLPCIRYASVQISGAPNIVLDDNCCTGQKLIKVDVKNAVPGDKYFYEFIPVQGIGISSFDVTPKSGEIYFGGTGSGVINGIASFDLDQYAQTILSFELTNTVNNYKVVDSIGLVCGTGVCGT